MSYPGELAKWNKFAFGIGELTFRPFHQWPSQGPISPLLSRYLSCPRIEWYVKVGFLIYVSGYYAIAISPIYVVAEAVLSVVNPQFINTFGERFDCAIRARSGIWDCAGRYFFVILT